MHKKASSGSEGKGGARLTFAAVCPPPPPASTPLQAAADLIRGLGVRTVLSITDVDCGAQACAERNSEMATESLPSEAPTCEQNGKPSRLGSSQHPAMGGNQKWLLNLCHLWGRHVPHRCAEPCCLRCGMGGQSSDPLKLGKTVWSVRSRDAVPDAFMIAGPTRTEKYLAAVAAGKWIVTREYVEASFKAGTWLVEEVCARPRARARVCVCVCQTTTVLLCLSALHVYVPVRVRVRVGGGRGVGANEYSADALVPCQVSPSVRNPVPGSTSGVRCMRAGLRDLSPVRPQPGLCLVAG